MGVCATKDAYMHFKHTISFVFWTKIIFMIVFAESFLLLGTNPTDKCCWISFLFRASVSTRSERRFSRLLKLAPVAVFQAWGLCESVAPWKSMHVQLSSKPWQACHLNAALAGDSEVMLCGHERGRRRNRALPALNHRQSSLFWWLVKSSSVWKPFFYTICLIILVSLFSFFANGCILTVCAEIWSLLPVCVDSVIQVIGLQLKKTLISFHLLYCKNVA